MGTSTAMSNATNTVPAAHIAKEIAVAILLVIVGLMILLVPFIAAFLVMFMG
jgi:hypothetical protein